MSRAGRNRLSYTQTPGKQGGTAMREIDLDTWNRKEHFLFFRRMDYPIYNICFDLDITDYKFFAKRNSLSFTNALLYLSIKSINELENFRYRVRGDKVVLHDIIHPSFAYLDDGSDLFKFVVLDYSDDIFDFNAAAYRQARAQQEFFPLEKLSGRDDFVFFSSIPGISFTGIDHTIHLNRDDAVPRITWGKYYERENRILLPYNIQVNHLFIDGYHLGKFKERLDANIRIISSGDNPEKALKE